MAVGRSVQGSTDQWSFDHLVSIEALDIMIMRNEKMLLLKQEKWELLWFLILSREQYVLTI